MTQAAGYADHRRAKKVARRLKTIDLEALTVAAPCPASWAEMEGDDRSRFCGDCEKNVYDLSNLTRDEIASLFAANDETVCGRLYRRSDGTVMTADCPVGLAARLKRRLLKRGGLIAAVLLLLLGWFGLRGGPDLNPEMGGMCATRDPDEIARLRAEQRRHLAEVEARKAALTAAEAVIGLPLEGE